MEIQAYGFNLGVLMSGDADSLRICQEIVRAAESEAVSGELSDEAISGVISVYWPTALAITTAATQGVSLNSEL